MARIALLAVSLEDARRWQAEHGPADLVLTPRSIDRVRGFNLDGVTLTQSAYLADLLSNERVADELSPAFFHG